MTAIHQASIQVQNKALTQTTPGGVSGPDMEISVSGALVEDLDQQLAQISKTMKETLVEKQALRSELEAIFDLKQNAPVENIDGVEWVNLSPEQAQLLGVTQSAFPKETENGEVIKYSLKKEDFDSATKASKEIREEQIAGLNSNSEMTALKVQALIDQRKNALLLMSNLISSAGEVAKHIIGNTK